MSFIKWHENLSIHFPTIDEQHKKLVHLVNLLHDAMKQGKGKEVLGKALDELINYTVYHFNTEEEYMIKHKYPELLSHKNEHKKLTEDVLKLKDKFEKGEAGITIEVMHFLKNWVADHIEKTDKKMGEYLAKHNA